MPFHVGNGYIEGGNKTFRIRDNTDTTVFEQGVQTYSGSNFGYLIQKNVPGFVATPLTDIGVQTVIGNGVWAKVSINFNTAIYNNGNHYDTVNTRFNVPITGPYLFICTHYMYTNGYTHPIFAVNGDQSLRRNSITYRMRGHGMAANYQQDMQIEEVIYCVAGDYVEPWAFSSGTTNYYSWYGTFQGVFVG